MPEEDTGSPPKIMITLAVALVCALAAVVAVFGVLANDSSPNSTEIGPLPLVPIPAPQAESSSCSALLTAAPENLTSNGVALQRRELAAPVPAGSLAWGGPESVVLRCGLDQPPELTQTSPLRVINSVQWLEVPGEGASTWYTVDRQVYIALTVPANSGTGPLQEISTTVGQAIPQVKPRE